MICYNGSAMKAIDLGHVVEKYKGLWVALTGSYHVISADKSVRKVIDEAKRKGYEKPTLFKVPNEQIAFIG